MFKNPGKKIKILAIFSFWITVIISIFYAFEFGWNRCYPLFRGDIFYFFLFGVPICAYFSTLLFVGFGDLIINAEKLSDTPNKDTAPSSEQKGDGK